MQLLSSWRESLALFLPHNFKQFIVSIYISIKNAYPLWLRYCWSFIGLLLILLFINQDVDISPISCLFFGIDVIQLLKQPYQLYTLIVYLAWVVAYFTLFLANKSSTITKNWTYFKSYFCRSWIVYVLLWFLVMPYLWEFVWLLRDITALKQGLLEIPGTPWHIAPFDIIYTLIFIIITAVSPLYILFLLDSDTSIKNAIKSLGRSIKMTLYNLPFCILMAALLFGIFLIISLPVMIIFSGLYDQTHNKLWYYTGILSSHLIMLFIFLPLLVAAATVFYTHLIQKHHNKTQKI
jgi:hypothetical protein